MYVLYNIEYFLQIIINDSTCDILYSNATTMGNVRSYLMGRLGEHCYIDGKYDMNNSYILAYCSAIGVKKTSDMQKKITEMFMSKFLDIQVTENLFGLTRIISYLGLTNYIF